MAPTVESPNTRALAAQVLCRVVGSRESLSTALDPVLSGLRGDRDRAFVRALVYGTIRWYYRLQAIVDRLLQRVLKRKDLEIRMLALLGIYQLSYMRVPAYGAVSATVDAAGPRPWARRLLNGLLRNYQRNEQALLEAVVADPVTRTAHPEWLVGELAKSWPTDFGRLLEANNDPPPMVLRVNGLQQGRHDYLRRLADQGIEAESVEWVGSAVRLVRPVEVTVLPGFQNGAVSVQDAAAQLAAGLLQLAAGMRVLDLCAAPGGKALHILETCPDLRELVAVDADARRLGRIKENLHRAGLAARLLVGDGCQPGKWWDGGRFDRILLDAPCSGTGVIRRHPDIKLLRLPEDIPAYRRQQRRLLESAWKMLAPGGVLLYATCSMLRQENDQQLRAFMESRPDAREWPIEAPWGREMNPGRQIFTGERKLDGFYYGRLLKAS